MTYPAMGSRSAGTAVVLAGGLLALLPWVEAGGRERSGLWLDLVAHLLALAIVALVVVAARRWRLRPLVLIWLPFGLIFGLSAWRAPYAYAAGLAGFELATGLALGLALAALLSGSAGETWRRRLGSLAILAGLPAALAACLQATLGDGRGAAGFINPNHLGAFLAALLPLALAGGLRREGWSRWTAILAAAVLGAGVLATGSRGALLAVVLVGMLALVQAARRSAMSRRGLAFAVTILIGFALASGASLWGRFADGNDIYRFDRLRIWPQAVAMASQEPLLGIGPGQFVHEARAHNFPRDDGVVRFGRSFSTPHSHLLLALAETGVLGLLALGLAVAGTVAAGRRGWDGKRGATSGVAHAAALGLAVLAVVSLFDEPLAHPPALLAAGVLAGLALPPIVVQGARRPGLARATSLAVVVTFAAGGGLLPAMAHHHAITAAVTPDPVRRVALLERAASLNPGQAFYPGEEAALLLSYARRPLDLVSYARIRAVADRAVELAPEEPSFRVTRARLERRACLELLRDRPACSRAVRDYREAARAAPKDPRVLRESAAFRLLLDQPEESVALLRRAVELEPGYIRAWSDLVVTLGERGRGPDTEWARAGLRLAQEQGADRIPDSDYARDILAPDENPAGSGGEGGGR
jgi:O-antigen ligase